MKRKLHFSLLPDMSFSHVLVRMGLGILLVFVCGTAYGQASMNISGTVTDSVSGGSLPGVNIVVKGRPTLGTATDAQGHYQLAVPSPGDTLVFTYIGYETKTVPINGQSSISVKMVPTTLTGGQLVVVGYSTQKKKDLTGSVSVVSTEDMKKQPVAEVTKQLQGNASGVSVVGSGQPGQQPSVHIRGFNTFGNNTPLYVVDGIPTQDISDLNPNDVASIQVLKDAGAASIYGSRASNGVIIITTKQGRGKINVTYNAYYGIQQPKQGNVWNILSPTGMMQLKKMALTNSGALASDNPDAQYGNWSNPRLPDYIAPAGAMAGDPSVNPSLYNVDPYYTNSSALSTFYRIVKANKAGTDWYHTVFKTKPMTDNNLTVSGGGQQGNYLFSADYTFQDGTLIYTYLKRYSLRANTNFNVTKNIRIGENLSYSVSENPQDYTLQEGGPIGMSYREQPIIPVFDIMGNLAGSYGPGLGNADNPYAIQWRTRNNFGQGNRLFGNVFADVNVTPDLVLRTVFGGAMNSSYYHGFNYPTYSQAENSSVNSFYQGSDNSYDWTWTNTATYQHTFNGVHQVEVILGTEANHTQGTHIDASTQGYFSFNPDFVNLATGSGLRTNNSYYYAPTDLFSLFGRLNYSYNDKYLLGFTIRRDGSSRFVNNKYGIFPAVSAGWRISKEKFMQGIPWLTDLKIRGSYGVMGNQLNVPADNGFSLYQGLLADTYYSITGSNSNIALGFAKSRIGAPDTKWEKDLSANIGLDATLFSGRLQTTIDYYRKDVSDLLYNPELPGTAGLATAPYINVGSMKNEGVDLSIRGNTQLTTDLNLNALLTFTTYNNKIEKIAQNVNYFQADSRRFNGVDIIRNQVGHAISSFYGYKIVGFWNSQAEINAANASAPSGTYQTDAAVGRFRYADIDGDGQITSADRTFLGNPNPKFSYGLNIGLTYKNFDFSVFFYGVQGNQLWNQVKWWTDFYASFQGAKSNTALYDSWTPTNHNAVAPIQENAGSFSTNEVPNSYYVEPGSYLRAKNIVLGYSLPSNVLNRIGVEKLRIYIQAANLFTITKYSGIDPEIGNTANSNSGTTDFGIDEGAYASPRTFLVGVNLGF